MTIKFCDKCNGLLEPVEETKKDLILRCTDCDNVMKFNKHKFLESTEEIPEPPKKAKGVVKDKNLLATYKHKCEKCGYDKSEIIERGVMISDEDTFFQLRCGKCGHTESLTRKPM